MAAANGSASVYSVEDLTQVTSLPNYPFATWSLAFDADGKRMIAGSWDGSIRVFSTQSWKVVQQFKGHEESVHAILAGTPGALTAGLDGRLQFWPSVATSSSQDSIVNKGVIQSEAKAPLWVTDFSPNGEQLFFAGGNQNAIVWDLKNQKTLASLDGHPVTRCATFSADGMLIATGGDDNEVRVVAVDNGQQLQRLKGHRGQISAVHFVDDGKTLISGDDPGSIRFWDVATGKQTDQRKRHTQRLYCAAVSPDEKWFVTGGGHWLRNDPGELIVWDLQSVNLLRHCQVTAIPFGPSSSRRTENSLRRRTTRVTSEFGTHKRWSASKHYLTTRGFGPWQCRLME